MKMIRVVKRTFDVLEYLAQDPEGNSRLTEIASAADLNASTCVRILKTLTNLGYVGKGRQRGRYSLGPRAYSIASQGPYRRNLVTAGEEVIAKLAGKLNESVLLAAIYRNRRTVLYEVEADRQHLQVRSDVVFDFENPFCTATGRLILAHLPPEEIMAAAGEIENYNIFWPGIETRNELMRALKSIRNQGWAINENGSEVIGMAVPVKEKGMVTSSLGVYLPTIRFSKGRSNSILQEMQLTAEIIEENLSGNSINKIH